ncbi:MAG: DUF6880 family protein, partial [Actinomycetes bacterium]
RVQNDGTPTAAWSGRRRSTCGRVRRATPDPTALAQRLFARATADEWGVFANVVADYADVLGPAGVATLRGLITEELQRLPRLAAGASADVADVHHATILGPAERAAKTDGVDAVVDVLAWDLRSAGRFQRICQELVAAGRVEQALEWARRDLAEFEGRIEPGLPDLRWLAASLCAQLGHHDEAVELTWRDFAVVPSTEGYQRLREYGRPTAAGRGGANAHSTSCANNRPSRRHHRPSRDTTGPGPWAIPYSP